MSQTSRDLVRNCLTFNYPERIPRDLWALPWAEIHYPGEVARIRERFPSDFSTVEYYYPPSPRVQGDPHRRGHFTDEWGCVFKNLIDGIIGEVIEPLIVNPADWRKVQPPVEQLPESTPQAFDAISRFYESTDKFVLANCCPRPWERYQFLRGTENALMDVLVPEFGFKKIMGIIHDFYLRELEFWAKSDCDALMFMDDWGAQDRLLISPAIWRELFKPLYREYCELARAHNKFIFMHSDGYIIDILDDLVEIGVSALNSQLFCMDFEQVAARAKGKLTFWGEIDRQQILPAENPEIGRQAVQKVVSHLYHPAGGVIAQFEFGPGTNPATAVAIFEEWDKISRGEH